jgi:hypothetical protein
LISERRANSFQLSLTANLEKNENADDPLFRPVDADDFRVNGDSARDLSNLVENGLKRANLARLPIRGTLA